MTQQQFTLRQYRLSQVLVLRKAIVERDHFKVSRHCKGCQIGVVPDFRRKQSTLSHRSPLGFKSIWFVGKYDSMIGEQSVVNLPGVPHRQRVAGKDLAICGESQKSHLRQPTKAATLNRSRQHPRLCRQMMRVRFEDEGQPEIDVRKMHLRRPELPRSSRSSNGHFRGWPSGRSEIQRAIAFWQYGLLAQRNTKRSRLPLPEVKPGYRVRRHHFENVLQFPCTHATRNIATNQPLIPDKGTLL